MLAPHYTTRLTHARPTLHHTTHSCSPHITPHDSLVLAPQCIAVPGTIMYCTVHSLQFPSLHFCHSLPPLLPNPNPPLMRTVLSSVVSVQITVSDINDNPPEFGQSFYSTSVSESLPTGASAFQVHFMQVSFHKSVHTKSPFEISTLDQKK